MSLFSLKLFPTFLGFAALCYGWGREGHRVVAHIAAGQLNKHARAEVARLLEAGETLESVASWADEIRPQRRETGPWHYINIPVGDKSGDWKPYCPAEGCVVQKLDALIAYLKSSSGSRVERAEALKFLVHFVGDMHQPLHTGDNRDRGGNDVKTIFRDQPWNLHSVWDTALVEEVEKREPAFREQPGRGLNWFSRCLMRRGRTDKWMWESRDQSRDVAYSLLSAERPAPITESYLATATPVVRKQLKRGGVRLAKVLNQIWP